jgi:hypothetical protein
VVVMEALWLELNLNSDGFPICSAVIRMYGLLTSWLIDGGLCPRILKNRNNILYRAS